MKNPSVALFLSLVLASQSAPGGGSGAADTAPIHWRGDLRAFAREIPKRHGAPWHATTKDQFDRAVAALDGRLDTLSSNAIAVEFARLAAMFGDGHTEMQLFDGPHAFRRLSVILYRFGPSLRVLAALPPYRDLLGAEVLAFGSTPAAEMLTRIEPYLAHDNEYEYLHQAPTTLASPEVLNALGATPAPDSAELTLRLTGGSTVTRTLPGITSFEGVLTLLGATGVEPPWSGFRRGQPYWFVLRPEARLAYLRIDQSSDQQKGPSIAAVVNDFFAQVDAQHPDCLIIDVRNNSGGNVARNVPIVKGVEARTKYRAKGALYVITGRTTFSAGTELVRDLLRVAAPLIAGEFSRGDPRVFVNREEIRLPSSGFRVDYSQQWTMRDSSGLPHLPLDLPAPPDFAAYAAGRDPAIEAILARIQQK
jgi:hypothetical protein